MSSKIETQYIRSITKRKGYSLGVFSGLALIAFAILYSVFAEIAQLPLIFLMSACIVGLVIAVCKVQEPDYSFMLNNQGLLYHHKRGFLLIEWENIQGFGIPTIHKGLDIQELSFIGVKLKQPESILPAISLRLISHLLIEQRATFHQYVRQNDINLTQSASELSLNTEPFKAQSGYVYKGLRGMFAHRMKYFRRYSGYDILIPATAFDRPLEEFIGLLRKHHTANLQAKAQAENSQ